MIDNRIVYTRLKVAKLQIDTENRGLQIAWNFIRDKITISRLASIVFQDKEVLDDSGIGGFFTTKSFVNILYLSKEYLRDGKLHFKDDKSAAVFLHECSHYLHLVSNQGRYSQKDDKVVITLPPASMKITPQSRYYTEREAWNLSLNLDKIFRIGLTSMIDRINARNMLILERRSGLRKLDQKELDSLETSMTIDQFHWRD